MITQLAVQSLAEARIEARPNLRPFVKWPGGKSSELPAIAASAPALTGRLIDPFVGGGAVLLATSPEVPAWANDACADLVRLYTSAARCDAAFRSALEAVAAAWDGFGALMPLYEELATTFRTDDRRATSRVVAGWSSALRDLLYQAGPGLTEPYLERIRTHLPAKFGRMRREETRVGFALSELDLLANVEGAVRAVMYLAIRARYNQARHAGEWGPDRLADFFVLRELAFAAMFRFNATGAFNVPYGGLTYNGTSLADKVDRMYSPAMTVRLAATEWRCGDFEPFLVEASPSGDDFVLVDPPYPSGFSTYDDRPFDGRVEQRLRQVLERLTARVMVVIKDTPTVRHLYASSRWRIVEAPKTYMWTIKSRNDRRAAHLTITNY